MTAAQIGRQFVLFVLITNAFVGDLVAFVAVVDFDHIALLGQFDAFFVRKFLEAPENRSQAIGLSMMKAVTAPLGSHILPVQVGLTAKCLNALVEDSFRLANVLLVDWDGRGSLIRSVRRGALCECERRQ